MKNSLTVLFMVVCMCLGMLNVHAQDELPQKAKKLFARAESAYSRFAYYSAIDYYKRFLTYQKSSVESKLKIADSYYKMKDYDQTLAWYDSVLMLGDLPPEHQFQYADVLMNHGMNEQARSWLKSYLEHNPDDKRAHEKLEGLENYDIFFRDSSLYTIANFPVNSPYSDFAPVYYKDGFVFVSGRKDVKSKKNIDEWSNEAYLDLYYIGIYGDSIARPEKLDKVINSKFHEGPLALYDSGRKMIFTRNNYVKKKRTTGEPNTIYFQLFYTEKNAKDEWTKPKMLSIQDKQYSIGHPAMSGDEKTLYFASNLPGGYGGSDLYKSVWQDGAWGDPVNLGPDINTAGNEMFPHIHQDSILYFSSDGFRGLGGLDIYKTSLAHPSGVFNLGFPINSTKDDFGILFNSQANGGFFSSNREGGAGHDDIYSFTVEVEPEKAPVEKLEIEIPEPEFTIEIYYTIQILALKNPKIVQREFLQQLKGVLKHDGKDGFHRYTYGEYEGEEEALATLQLIKKMGYQDAFIRRVERYVELSEGPGENVDLLYEQMGRIQ